MVHRRWASYSIFGDLVAVFIIQYVPFLKFELEYLLLSSCS